MLTKILDSSGLQTQSTGSQSLSKMESTTSPWRLSMPVSLLLFSVWLTPNSGFQSQREEKVAFCLKLVETLNSKQKLHPQFAFCRLFTFFVLPPPSLPNFHQAFLTRTFKHRRLAHLFCLRLWFGSERQAFCQCQRHPLPKLCLVLNHVPASCSLTGFDATSCTCWLTAFHSQWKSGLQPRDFF